MATMWKSAAAGLIGGIVAAAAMDVFQRPAAALFKMGTSDDEPATAKAADAASRIVTGRAVPDDRKDSAGLIVHYLTGAGLGLVYGAVAARRPAVTAGFGSAYGLGVAAVVDNGVVPLAGWGSAPWHTDAKTQGYGATSHLVFGTVLETTRRVIVAVID